MLLGIDETDRLALLRTLRKTLKRVQRGSILVPCGCRVEKRIFDPVIHRWVPSCHTQGRNKAGFPITFCWLKIQYSKHEHHREYFTTYVHLTINYFKWQYKIVAGKNGNGAARQAI